MNASSALRGIISGIFLLGVAASTTQASIIEVGDLNIIDDPGNPSDGLRYLDMSFSDGFSSAGAIANAQLSYANARLATPSEFDDLFAAAGIISDGAISASDGFLPGEGIVPVSSGSNYDGGTLFAMLGVTTFLSATQIWTDPDGDIDAASTRDYLQLNSTNALVSQAAGQPPSSDRGWLLVSEAAAVPEASESLVFFLGITGLIAGRRRKRQQKTTRRTRPRGTSGTYPSFAREELEVFGGCRPAA